MKMHVPSKAIGHGHIIIGSWRRVSHSMSKSRIARNAIFLIPLLALAAVLWFPRVHVTVLLAHAARADNLAEFKRLEKRVKDLNAPEKGFTGDTPLIGSIFAQGSNVFYYLLSKGVDIEARNTHGETPLSYAVLYGDEKYDKVQALIEKGADVNANCGGASVLKHAKWAHNPPRYSTNVVRLLQAHGTIENP